MQRSFLISSALALLMAGCTTAPIASDFSPATPASTAGSATAATVAETTPLPARFQTYSADTFFNTTSFSLSSSAGFTFSSDGERVLVSSDQTGVFNAYAMDAEGVLKPLTISNNDAHFAVSFFPDDDRVLVSADQGGNELSHVYLRDDTGTLTDLTPGENVRATFGGWREDGGAFYIWTNERNPAAFDLYAYDTTTYERALILENPGYSPGPISPSGQWAALSKLTSSADSDVYVVNLFSGNPTPVLATEHEGNVAHGAYGFTADNTKLIYSTNEFGEFSQAWTYDLGTGDKAPLIAADWDVSFVTESPSGRYQVSALNADALTELTITDTETGTAVTLPGVPEGELSQVRFSRDESQIAFGVNTDTSPRNLYLAKIGEPALRLTNALNPDIDEAHLVTATVERFDSFDDVSVPGILYRPHQASSETPVPAVVLVHGGPGGQSTRGYSAMVQHLVNHGYAVYAANNRGSSGYGKTFFHMDDKRHGEEDLRDIVEAGNYLRDLDWVDDNAVAVMGGSYGGYMTAAALTFHPTAFEAGINIFGVTNWERTLKSIPAWWGATRDALFDEMGDPATDAERHRAISPLFHAENIARPMLVIQGANDPRVLQIESDEIVAAARENGLPVDYIVFPDEGHGFLKRTNRITASEAYLRFLNTYLKGQAAAD